MEVHNHSLETLGVNRDADKSLNPEFKDILAPSSGHIPDMENFTIPPSVHSNDVHVKEGAANNSDCVGASAPPISTFGFPPALSDLNTAPSDINFQAHGSVVEEQNTQHDGDHQVGDQEEAFDDMVNLDDVMVTCASLSGEGGGDAVETFQDPDIQMEDFQQANIFNAFPVASDVPCDTSAGENPEVPSIVVTETIITSEVVVQEVTPTELATEDLLPPSHESEVISVTPSDGQAVDAGKAVHTEEVLPSDMAEANKPEATDTTEVVNPANSGKELVQKSGPGAGIQEVSEEDIKEIKGQKVVKKFGRKSYSGEVTDFDPETRWFKVVYDDGDDEDLELWEVKLILASALSSPSSSKKRPRKESSVDGSSKSSSKKPRKSGADTTAKKTKSASKGSAKSPKTPGSKAKGSRGAKHSSVSSKKRSSGKLIKKALDLESSAFKTPVESQGKEGKGRGKVGTSTPKSNKRGSSKKAKTVKSSRTLNLLSPKGREQVEAESSGSKRATKSPKQLASGLKRKAVSVETTAEKSKRAKKGATEAESDVSSLVGRGVKKNFNGVLYTGAVVKRDLKTGYFKVKYEDGDSEDLERVELEAILMPEAGNVVEREDNPAKLSSSSSLMSGGKKSHSQRRK